MRYPLRLPIIALSLALLASGSDARAGRSEPSPGKIKKILVDRVDRHRHAPGIVVGIVSAAGVQIVSHGTMSTEDTTPVDGNTLFEIGSLTKLFTALTLADMVERDEVKLDAPISPHLPSDVNAPSKEGEPIRWVHLARHVSGLSREPDNYSGKERYAPDTTYSAKEMFEFIGSYELERKPGVRHEYSNLGFGLLGELLARHADRDYDTLIRERICRPLKMEHTSVQPTEPARFATGHLLDRSPVESYVLEGLQGAGALKSSINDLVRFLAANLGMLPTSLDPAITRAQIGRRDFGFPANDKRLAWSVTTADRSEVFSHDGKTWGFRAFLALSRSRRFGVVILSNSQHDIADLGWHLMDRKNKLAPPKQAEN